MLFSHRFQFLFVHIPKTGGTSVRTALARIRYRDPLYIPQFVCNCLSHLTRHRIGAKLPRQTATQYLDYVIRAAQCVEDCDGKFAASTQSMKDIDKPCAA